MIAVINGKPYDFRHKDISDETIMNIINILEKMPNKGGIFKLPDNIWTKIGKFFGSSSNYRLTCSQFYSIAQQYIPVNLNISAKKIDNDVEYSNDLYMEKENIIVYNNETEKYIHKFMKKNIISSITLIFFDDFDNPGSSIQDCNLPIFLLNNKIENVRLINCKNIKLNHFQNIKSLTISNLDTNLHTVMLNNICSLELNNVPLKHIDFSKMPNITSLTINNQDINDRNEIDISCLLNITDLNCETNNNWMLGNHPNLKNILLSDNNKDNNNRYFISKLLPSLDSLDIYHIIPRDMINLSNITSLRISELRDNILYLESCKQLTDLFISDSYKIYDIEKLPLLQSLTIEDPVELLDIIDFRKITSLKNLKIYNDYDGYNIDVIYNIDTTHMNMLENLYLNVGMAFGKTNKNIKSLSIVRPEHIPCYIDLLREYPYLEELYIHNKSKNKRHAMEIDLAFFPQLKSLKLYGIIDISNDHLLDSIEKVEISLKEMMNG